MRRQPAQPRGEQPAAAAAAAATHAHAAATLLLTPRELLLLPQPQHRRLINRSGDKGYVRVRNDLDNHCSLGHRAGVHWRTSVNESYGGSKQTSRRKNDGAARRDDAVVMMPLT